MADRIKRNCSDNINNITYRKRLIENKTYLMKYGHNAKDIDKVFCKRAITSSTETLKKKSNRKRNNKIRFITAHEPSLPNIYNTWRKTNHLKNNKELKNIFKNA